MKLSWAASAALTIGMAVLPAYAVPPTATPSPGYDARLKESRAGSATTIHTKAPRPPKARPKMLPQQ